MSKATAWTRPHLLGIDALSTEEIVLLLDAAERHFRPSVAPRESLRGRTVLLALFEP